MRSLPDHPFLVSPPDQKTPRLRSLKAPEGVVDRLRSIAFAELQAREGFRWAAEQKAWNLSPELNRAWSALAKAEDHHMTWLLDRLAKLGFDVKDRAVSDFLWRSFERCSSAEEFSIYMASAELWGQETGENLSGIWPKETLDPPASLLKLRAKK